MKRLSSSKILKFADCARVAFAPEGATRAVWLTMILAMTLGAQAALGGMAVSPLKRELSLRPGEQVTLSLVLANNNRNENGPPQSARVEVADVHVSEEGTLSFNAPATRKNSASRWITLEHNEVNIEAGKSLAVHYTVNVPQSAAPGEYYSAIIVTLATKGRTNKGVSIEYRVASGVFVTVLGRTLSHQAKITYFELVRATAPDGAATQPAEFEPLKIVVVLRNTGEARFDGTGKVTFLDDQSRPVFSASLASARPCVFAGDSRQFETPITQSLPAGKYRAVVQIDYQFAWSKARQSMSVEILPADALALAARKRKKQEEASHLEAAPQKLAATVHTGATRSLVVNVTNRADHPLACNAAVTSLDDAAMSWIASGIGVEPAQFTLDPLARKSIELRLHVPADAKPGMYEFSLDLDCSADGSGAQMTSIPLAIEVK